METKDAKERQAVTGRVSRRVKDGMFRALFRRTGRGLCSSITP